jgi:hypothetical protein
MRAHVAQALEVAAGALRVDHRREPGRVRRDTRLSARPRFRPEVGHAEVRVLVRELQVASGVGGLGHAPRDVERPRRRRAGADGAALRLLEQAAGRRVHHERRHQVLEHRPGPRPQHRAAPDRASPSAEAEPVPRLDVALRDREQAREPRLGGEQVVAARSRLCSSASTRSTAGRAPGRAGTRSPSPSPSTARRRRRPAGARPARDAPARRAASSSCPAHARRSAATQYPRSSPFGSVAALRRRWRPPRQVAGAADDVVHERSEGAPRRPSRVSSAASRASRRRRGRGAADRAVAARGLAREQSSASSMPRRASGARGRPPTPRRRWRRRGGDRRGCRCRPRRRSGARARGRPRSRTS